MGYQRIFVSYARKDGAELALRLQKHLTALGFKVWIDTQGIGGGASWTVEIEEAIERAEVVLAVLTPGSYASEICRAEHLRSLRKGKCVIPLLAVAGSDVPLYLETKNYRKFSDEREYDASFPLLVGDIEGRKGAALAAEYVATRATYISVPPTVANEIKRPEAVRALRDALFAADGHRAVALTAVSGMGGIGKTVLAQALFKDEVVREAFPDGLVWITVGREPTYNLDARLREIAKVIGGASDVAVAAETLYRTTIADKAALIVIDDIWSKADLDPFLAESARSRFVFTTRDAGIARFSGAREHGVDLLDAGAARELLAQWAGVDVGQLPAAAEDVLRECGGLPLALSTVGAMLREASRAEWSDTAGLLRNADLRAIEEQLPPGQTSFFRAIDVSVNALTPEMQRRYGRLAVLLEDMPAALPVLETLWNVDEAEARRIGRHLAGRSLAQRDGEDGIRLHDLQLDYVRAKYADREALELIHGAVRLSAHVIEKDARQFASQVVGRLLVHRAVAGIQQFIDEISMGAPGTWIRPLHPALCPPGTPLLRILEGHTADANAVAVTPNGKRAVSASGDRTLKVWDLDSGREVLALEGHSASVTGVAVTADGKRAVSASEDHNLQVWDLETGIALHILQGHADSVFGVAVTPDGKKAVSASGDKTLKVWDLESGIALRTLHGHTASAYGVAITPDGKQAVSASGDTTLKVWDLESGIALRTLEGHSDMVYGVTVTYGKRAVSASADLTLRVWDLETGSTLRTLEGHSAAVSGVVATPDGNRVVSVSGDKTLMVWDLDTGSAVYTLKGHSSYVSGVAVTADGKRAISASGDHTLRVWDLETGPASRELEGHSALVAWVAVTPDGKRAVSASEDKTLKVWELDTGRAPVTLEGHSAAVNGVAVMPDGKRAVSASRDKTLKVWELGIGHVLVTLEGHSAAVLGVAVTADGKRAVSASWDNTLKVWDMTSGGAVVTLRGHTASVEDVALTPDGKWAVSASGDQTLKVWELETGAVLHTMEGHSAWVYGVAVTPDGRRAVSASEDHNLKVWDLEKGVALRTLEGHSAEVRGVAVTPDGKRAVSASVDKTLKVWELGTGRVIATFHCDAAAHCCACVDEQRIVAGDAGGRVYILSLEERK